MFDRELDINTAYKDERGRPIMETAKAKERGFGKRWYQKLKAARYTFMLSSPLTGIRNAVSNIIVTVINRIADSIGNLIRPKSKKAYRVEQWKLAGVKTSEEVKSFIEDNFKNSELFELLYDGTTKYDDRAKDVNKQRDLFMTMIVSAIEQRYAAAHKFDSDTANTITKIVGKMISDKPFIKFATNNYFSKILTQEVEAGKVSLSGGISNEILDLFASSVIEANKDYMHKRSFMADMNRWSKRKSTPSYMKCLLGSNPL